MIEISTFDYGALWQVFVSIWLFQTNSWLIAGVVLPNSFIHISDHGFICLLKSVISTDKFRFDSVVTFVINKNVFHQVRFNEMSEELKVASQTCFPCLTYFLFVRGYSVVDLMVECGPRSRSGSQGRQKDLYAVKRILTRSVEDEKVVLEEIKFHRIIEHPNLIK